MRSPEISRIRKKRAGALLLSSALLLTGCGENPKTAGTYSGPIEAFVGKDILSDTKLDGLLSELILTKAPLLTKVARDIKTLHTSTTNPTDFSPQISEDTTPLIIVSDNTTLTSSTNGHPKYGDTPAFQFTTTKGASTSPVLESFTEALLIANQPVLAGRPLEQAVFLAKEGLTLGIINRIGTELGEEYSPIFTDLNGNPITDSVKLEQYGMTILSRYGADKNTDIAKATDLLPFMMLSIDIEELVRNGTIPAGPSMLGPFFQTIAYLEDHPELKAKIKTLYQSWIESNQTTGPEGFSKDILVDPSKTIITGIRELFTIIYPAK